METSDTPDTNIATSPHLPPPLPPPGEGPEPKKLKMSTTATSDDEEVAGATDGAKKQRYKRRKIAIFFAYCGVGYQGMQKNPGAKTIEGDLEEALFHAGAVPEQDRGNPKRYDWARSARTDKGVSAVGQVVSGRFYIDPPGLVERLNQILPAQIRIFGYKRVTASFNSKKFCDRRRYVYLIPVFALDPSCHRDRESVMASLGSGNELVKCLECSERGRKVAGVMGKRSFEAKSTVVQSDISNNGDDINVVKDENLTSEFKDATDSIVQNQSSDAKSIIVQSDISSNNGDDINLVKEDNLTSESKEVSDSSVQNEVTDVDVDVDVDRKPVEERKFCYGEEEKERFNRILKHYVGSHNFHNFTTRTKAEDPAARRYIISFNANTVVNVEGMDFVKCEVVGQSFMLHQIRKMMGMAVAVMRNCAPESLIETALRKDVHINVPTAPEVGLYLDECLFASYNQKWKDSHEELSMKAYEEEAEEFKMKFIYSHIASTEREEGVVGLWLHSLNHRNYPDLRACDGKAVEGKSPKVDDNADTTEEKTAAVEKNGNNDENAVEGKSPKVDDNADTTEEKTAAVEKNGNNDEVQSTKEEKMTE
ncbi:Pseudouridine synthase I, TruA [Corchorus capsularis]|uniref:Pseudouridine synthase I, TruA n=1 Tax=Corchorus capsularis TaxID=210143 RepID=A0A1R3H5F5_COCAP|nr:Pseudouridine synthase I, TruA [Corchorus capsularis]